MIAVPPDSSSPVLSSPVSPADAALASALAATRRVAIGSALALIGLGLAWELWIAPTGQGTLALKVLPLLLIVPGLWRGRLYTYRWASLLVWLYVIEALVRSTSDRGRGVWLAVIEFLLCLMLFGAVAGHVRFHLKAARLARETEADIEPPDLAPR